MNPGLRYLLVRRLPGALRRLGRRFLGREGRILLVGTGLLFAAILATQSTFTGLASNEQFDSMRPTPEGIRVYAPLVLLLVALVGIRSGAFYFKSAEVQFLFPAPIPRIQLLIFNILSRMQIVLLSTLWVSIFVVRQAATWYGGVLAVFMLLSFNQLAAQLAGIWLASLDAAPAARRRRRYTLLALVLLLGIGVMTTLPASPSGLAETAAMLLGHPLVNAVTWITRPFVELFLSEDPGELLFHGGIASAILGAEVFAMLRLDRRYLDGFVESARGTRAGSTKVRLGAHRHPRGQTGRTAGLRLRIRGFPRSGGAGPLAWRQLQELLRQPGQVLRGALGLLAVLPVFVIRAAAAEDEAAGLGVASVATALLMIPMMVDGADFRRDLDRMSLLRAMPISAPALVIGQLIPTTLLLGFWMFSGSIMILILIDMLSINYVFLLSMTIPPFALMTAAIDNWLFLLMPYRVRTRDPGESTFVGRLTIVMTIKVVAMVLSISLSLGAIFLLWEWVRESLILIGLVAFGSLTCCCIPLVFGVARCFKNFDVAGQAPE